jgi:sensor histidine kinase YesM
MRMDRPISRSQLSLEVGFFSIYFVVGGLFPTLENAQQFISQGTLGTTVWYFFITGTLNIFPFLCYYRLIIPRFLFRKKYLQFIAALFLFLIAYDLYLRYIDWLLSQIGFLPAGVQQLAASKTVRNAEVWISQGISFSVTYLIGVTALAYFINYYEREREMNDLKADQLQLELDYLKAQINPHFFFNTLNNIYSLALDKSPFTAPVVLRLSEMMQYVMRDSGISKVMLEQEIDFIRNYVNIERIRFSDHISIDLKQEGETGKLLIEPLLLIPFVENAFKHGVREEPENGYVNILILISKKNFTLNVKNSIAETKTDNKNGLGLQNVQKRLSLLYPGKHTLRLDKTDSTYDVTLELKLD